MSEHELIQGCLRDDRIAHRTLFDRYSPRMFAVCKRYVKQREDAEDVMIEGLYKAITKMETYKGDGSFEGWLRRIMVNECLMFLRKQSSLGLTMELDDRFHQLEDSDLNIADSLAGQDILALLDKLPTGYRTVFNLYVIEGFKHREIAEMLNISINTSKSQLILAKDKLRQILTSDSFLRKTS
jgi:RNA polymerase sigma factor (sigma-70 family)